MTEILAAMNNDPMISGNWIIGVIGAIAAAVALVVGKMQGKQEAQRTRLESPVPEVPTRKISTPPTWDAHQALIHRVTHLEGDMQRMGDDIKAIRHEQAAQFKELMKEGASRELRLGEKLEGIAIDIHRRIDAKL